MIYLEIVVSECYKYLLFLCHHEKKTLFFSVSSAFFPKFAKQLTNYFLI